VTHRYRSALLATALAAGILAGCSGQSEKLKLATGPQGGTWYPLGGALKNVIEKQLGDVSIQVLPGGGIANVLAVDSGKADIALANSVSTVDAINGQPPFEAKATHVCNLATLYPQYFQVVTLADAGIDTPADLKGKTLATQPKGNTGEAMTAHLLKAYGLSYDDLSRVNYGSYTDSVGMMKDGNAQVFTLGTAIPAGAVMDLASARTVKLLDIPDDGLARMKTLNQGYQRIVIPAGTYPEQTRDVATIGYATHIIVRCDLPDRVVAGVLDGVYGSRTDLAAVAKAMVKATLRSMAEDIGVPMHPAAARWYQDKGTS
jgi:TRAP transporter TAXI family solute receptor